MGRPFTSHEYTPGAGAWKICRALAVSTRPMTEDELAACILRTSKSSGRIELSRLTRAGYLRRVGDDVYHLLEKGRAFAAGPRPERTQKPVTPAKAAPVAIYAPTVLVGERIADGDRRALEQVAAVEGLPVAAIADRFGRGVRNLSDRLHALARYGLITLPIGGANAVPRLTPAGRERLTMPEPSSKTTNFKGLPTPDADKPYADKVLAALAVLGNPCTAVDLATKTDMMRRSVERHLNSLARDGYARIVDVGIWQITEKGRRTYNGERFMSDPQISPTRRPSPPPQSAAPMSAESLDGLIPAGLRTLRGVRHPPIPSGASKPEKVSATAWLSATTLDLRGGS